MSVYPGAAKVIGVGPGRKKADLVLAILEIEAGVLLLLADKKGRVFSFIATLVLAIWLIVSGAVALLEIGFSGQGLILGILAIFAGILILIGMKKGQWSKHLGGLILAIWLILTGLTAEIELAFSGLPIILAILAIASGILFLLKH